MKTIAQFVTHREAVVELRNRKVMNFQNLENSEADLLSSGNWRPRLLAISCYHWVCAGALMLAVVAAPTLQANQISTTAEGPKDAPQPSAVPDFYDDPDGDYPDDGSDAVRGSSEQVPPGALIPISPLEESGLLGDWGDSEDEAED